MCRTRLYDGALFPDSESVIKTIKPLPRSYLVVRVKEEPLVPVSMGALVSIMWSIPALWSHLVEREEEEEELEQWREKLEFEYLANFFSLT